MKKVNQKTEMMKKVMFIILLLLTVPAIHALAGGLRDMGGDAGGGAPIDGGISFLVAAAVGYGVKKTRDEKKKAKIQREKAGV